MVVLACTPLLLTAAESRAGDCSSIDTEQCNALYDPVCANWDTGIRCIMAPCPSAESRLYTNACLACQDKRVNSFQFGECAERPEPKVGQRLRLEIEDLVGRRSHRDRGHTVVELDLGISEPIYVTAAWLWIEGMATPGSAQSLDPGEGVVEMPVKVNITIEELSVRRVFRLGRPLAQLGPFEGPFKAEGVLKSGAPLSDGINLEMLRDGKAQLRLSFPPTCPGGCTYLEDAVMDIQRAELVVDYMLERDLPQRAD